MHVFQYKTLKNIICIDKKLFLFKESTTSLCSFCKSAEETTEHIFSVCQYTKAIWTHFFKIGIHSMQG